MGDVEFGEVIRRDKTEEIVLGEVMEDESQINNNFSIGALVHIFKTVGWPILNITIIYIPKYLFLSCLTYFATEYGNTDSLSWVEQNAYAIVYLGYNSGQFFGKSSLTFFKLRYVEIATSFIFCALILYSPCVYYFDIPIYIQFVILFVVGVACGLSYCNCGYLIMDSKELGKNNMELAFTIESILIDTSMMVSTLIALVIVKIA